MMNLAMLLGDPRFRSMLLAMQPQQMGGNQLAGPGAQAAMTPLPTPTPGPYPTMPVPPVFPQQPGAPPPMTGRAPMPEGVDFASMLRGGLGRQMGTMTGAQPGPGMEGRAPQMTRPRTA